MAGENTGRIVDILFKKKDVNEFSIAKKMDLTINQVGIFCINCRLRAWLLLLGRRIRGRVGIFIIGL